MNKPENAGFLPSVGIAPMAFGAVAVAAGMVGVLLVTALVAGEQVPAHRGGPALKNILERAAVAGQHGLAKRGQIFFAVTAQNIRHF